jgi:DNA-binding HxlR family transcriptional regulator
MKKKERARPAVSLPELCHHRWAIPALAALHRLGGGAKFITLQYALGTGRDSLVRTLDGLLTAGLALRNPGYGHPMRPEYLLSPAGKRLAPACLKLVELLDRTGTTELALNKWSLPVLYALAQAGGRFNALRAQLPGITPRALALALRDLELAGLVTRTLVDDHPPRTEYGLTRRGKGLLPLLNGLAAAAESAFETTR